MDKYFFHYSYEDEELINILKEYLNENIKEITSFFDVEIIDNIDIYIIDSKEEYDRLRKKETPGWEVAFAGFNKITIISNKYLKKSIDYYKKLLLHEFVHVITYLNYVKNDSSIPRVKYLNEGIAEYLSHQRDNEKLSFNFSLEDLLNNKGHYYEGGYILTKYILEKYGKEYFLEVINDEELLIKKTPKIYEEAKIWFNEELV